MAETTPPIHLRLRGNADAKTERLALRATLAASHLLGLATGTHLRFLCGLRDPLAEAQPRVEEAELRARLAWEAVEILSSRLAKIPERHRPYYSPAARSRILEMRNLLAWSAQETARGILVCPNAILNWERAADPQAHSVGSCVKPQPPVRRAHDVVRSLAQLMSRLGFGGQDLISRILARAGWKVSARSVGRYRKQRTVSPLPPPTRSPRTTQPVVARFVHHVWMMDVSEVKQFLGPSLHMAAVFDAFSRAPRALCASGQTNRRANGPAPHPRRPALRETPLSSSPTGEESSWAPPSTPPSGVWEPSNASPPLAASLAPRGSSASGGASRRTPSCTAFTFR